MLSWLMNLGFAGGQSLGYPATLNDLTTEFHQYLIDLHNATPGQHDSNPLVRDDVATMLQNTNVALDRNTQYAQYLTS